MGIDTETREHTERLSRTGGARLFLLRDLRAFVVRAALAIPLPWGFAAGEEI